MTSDTPLWTSIRSREPEVHSALQMVGRALLREEAPELPEERSVGVSRAVELGLLVRQEAGFAFADSAVRDEYLARLAASEAAESWEDDVAFPRTLDEACRWGTLSGAEPNPAARALVLLAAEGRDVVGRLGRLAEPPQGDEDGKRSAFWSLYPALCDALPHLDQEPEDVASGLKSIREAVGNDLASGLVHSAVRAFAARSHAHGERLLAALEAMPGVAAASLAADAVIALAGFDRTQAHDRAIALSRNADAVLQAAGIRALGELPYGHEGDDPLLEDALRRLDELRRTAPPEVSYALPPAYGELLPLPDAEVALVDLAGRSAPSVQYTSGLTLLRKAEEHVGSSWFDAALHRVLTLGPLGSNTLRHLDAILSKRAKSDAGAALACVETWAANGGLGGPPTADLRLPDAFPSTLRVLRTEAVSALEAAITRWFASDDRHLHQAAWEVVGGHDFDAEKDGAAPLRLSTSVLDASDETVVQLIVQRLLAYVVGGLPLAVLLLSVLRRNPCPPALARFVGAALSEAIYNYPQGAGDYLRWIAGADDSPDADRTLARGAVNGEDAYLAARRGLPPAPELVPPSSRTFRLALAQQKHRSGIIEAARNQSALIQLFNRIPLKYGRAFSVERDGVALPPQELSTFSHEMEIPRGEIIDPLGQTLLRLQRRTLRLRNLGEPDEPIEEPEGEP